MYMVNKKANKKQKKRKFKDVISCGGILFFTADEKIYYLILKHKGGKKHWDIPKGHIEDGESFLECATREIIEETGISAQNLTMISDLKHKNIYVKKRKLRKPIRKTVHLFLFQSSTDEVYLSSEHKSFKWVKFKQLKDTLTYETSLPAFEEAKKIISLRKSDISN